MKYEFFHKLKRLEIQTKKLVDELFAGQWLSTFKGRGIEFEELREYSPGDPLSSIDWNVTARMNAPYVKLYREERELSVMLLVDLSSSTLFGSQAESKRERIAELAALLAFSAIKNYDKVGLMLFTNEIEKVIIPKKGVTHGLRVLRDVLYHSPKAGQTDIQKALAALGNLQKKSSIVFLFSDFLFPVQEKLYYPIAKKHDFISICMQDPLEQEMEDLGYLHLQDLETDRLGYYDFRNPKIRKEYAKSCLDFRDQHKRSILKSGGSFLQVRSDISSVDALKKFLQTRTVR